MKAGWLCAPREPQQPGRGTCRPTAPRLVIKPPIGQAPGKRQHVEAMFDAIAPRYDLANRLLSFGTDVRWRTKAVDLLAEALRQRPERLLDVATGTADLAIEALSLEPDEVVGVDISNGMLEGGRAKVEARGLTDRVTLVQADAADLPFPDASFDGAFVSFGVRNFEDLGAGLAGIRRVLRPQAPLVVLETSQPTRFPFRQGYRIYSRHIMPRVGRAVSGSAEAYEYLPESAAEFPYGEAFLEELRSAGFSRCVARPVTFGVASLYRGLA